VTISSTTEISGLVVPTATEGHCFLRGEEELLCAVSVFNPDEELFPVRLIFLDDFLRADMFKALFLLELNRIFRVIDFGD
jgi:hypothetical protein